MPCREAAQHKTDYPGDHGQHDVVYRHEGFIVLPVGENLAPDPVGAHSEAEDAEERGVDEEEKEGFVVAETNAGG